MRDEKCKKKRNYVTLLDYESKEQDHNRVLWQALSCMLQRSLEERRRTINLLEEER